jgi:hypothetical protein
LFYPPVFLVTLLSKVFRTDSTRVQQSRELQDNLIHFGCPTADISPPLMFEWDGGFLEGWPVDWWMYPRIDMSAFLLKQHLNDRTIILRPNSAVRF